MKKKEIKTKAKELDSTPDNNFLLLVVTRRKDKRKLTWGDKFTASSDKLPTAKIGAK